MSHITLSIESAWETIDPLMIITTSNEPKWGVFSSEDIENVKSFLNLVENAYRLHKIIIESIHKRGGFADEPVSSVTISSEVALSVAYVLERCHAA